MTLSLRLTSFTFIVSTGLFLSILLLGSLLVTAQEDAAPELAQPLAACVPMLERFYTVASEMCLGKPDGHVCNGGMPPRAEPAGPVSSSLATTGALIPVDAVEMLHTSSITDDGTNGGLMWMRVPGTHMRALLIGNVNVRDVTPPGMGFPAWTALNIQTDETEPVCSAVPRSAFIAQSNFTSGSLESTRIVINGASLDLRGTVIVQTQGSETVFTTLEGELRVIANSQTQGMVAGQQVRVSHNPGDFSRVVGTPGMPLPFDPILVRNFPIALLDRPTVLPQPGFVATEGAVNLRSSPSTNAGLIMQVPPGQIMTILGRNPAGDWYHVRLPSGETGWMFADLLRQNHGEISAVYSATPVPPQRYGEVGTRARVLAPAGVSMRSAPDVGFSAIFTLEPASQVELLARSPYSPWVKVDAGGMVGWVALITLETQSIIESLPIDYNVPPPPEPTRVPGSWGGAFPDPTCYPNC